MFANSSLSVESLSQLTLEKERKKKTNKRNVTFYKMMMLITFNDDQTIADLATFWVLTNLTAYIFESGPMPTP